MRARRPASTAATTPPTGFEFATVLIAGLEASTVAASDTPAKATARPPRIAAAASDDAMKRRTRSRWSSMAPELGSHAMRLSARASGARPPGRGDRTPCWRASSWSRDA